MRMEKALRSRVAQKVTVQHTRGFIHGELEESWPHFEVHGEEAFFRFSPVEVRSITKDILTTTLAGPAQSTDQWYIRLKV